jgi:peptidoglycan/xylan/chitin deacetylase (PgdA/CDA1 family)
MVHSSLWPRLRSRYQRNAARVWFKRPFVIPGTTPIISFSFDDFPRSALLAGGAILNRFGLRGTYYASFGLMGQTAPTGAIFEQQDLDVLVEQGHELGCHTFDHCHSWDTPTSLFEKSVVKNEAARQRLVPSVPFRSLSYPISPPRPLTKRILAARFGCSRGGGQTFNAGLTDLNHLKAYFLEKSRDNPEAVTALIEENRRVGGWLVLATHDVSPDPTPYGCTPEFFEAVVETAIASGARILPVGDALDSLRASDPLARRGA